jgi:hypothetical protein
MYSCTKFDFPRIIRGKSEFSMEYTEERHAFPRYNSRNVKTFRELYGGKYAIPRYNPRKGMWSRIILRQGRLFHCKIRGKFRVFADYPADNSRKVTESQTFRE